MSVSRQAPVRAFLVAVALLIAPAARADDEKDIRAVLDAQAAAWNKGDLDGFMAGYWNDDKLTFISGGDITSGWKKTKERYEKRYKADGKEMGKLTFSEIHVETFGPTAAMLRGKFELVFEKEKDEKKKTPRGRFTLIMKKFPDGWKIVHDHTSAEDAAPAPAAPPVGAKGNPWRKPTAVQVAPLPRLVPKRNETEDEKIARAWLGCRRIEEAITAYQNHPKNPGKTPEERLPSDPRQLLNLPFGGGSLLPNGQEEFLDPWDKAYQFELRKRMDGTYVVLIHTTAEDGTQISQFGIGPQALPTKP